jgi:hypothetical protein
MLNVLYLIFNRPHLQSLSFEKIREAKPDRLFIAADGPRRGNPTDNTKCGEARSIIEQVDWKCEVKTFFREENAGCRKAVGEAITWFFRHVDEGIILEDDCLASPAFFTFAQNLLEYYKEDQRIWCISGNNFQSGISRGDGSYYFSRYNHCWGWASWRRCWVHYDDEMSLWPPAKRQHAMRYIFQDPYEQEVWERIWDDLTSKCPYANSWALRWSFAAFINSGLTVLPNRNLVTNIGFGQDGTHCFGTTFDPGIQEFEVPIKHPSYLVRDAEADELTFKHIFGTAQVSRSRLIFSRITRCVKKPSLLYRKFLSWKN